jgi:flagellar protein FliO/FliZ
MSGRRVIVPWLAAGLFALAALQVVAADKPAPTADAAGIIYPGSSSGRTESAAGHGSGYNAVLVVALFLAGAGGWLFWRGRAVPRSGVPVRKLAIAETKSLGNRQFLVVASYDDKKYLLGVCPGRIELLTPLEGAPPAKSP